MIFNSTTSSLFNNSSQFAPRSQSLRVTCGAKSKRPQYVPTPTEQINKFPLNYLLRFSPLASRFQVITIIHKRTLNSEAHPELSPPLGIFLLFFEHHTITSHHTSQITTSRNHTHYDFSQLSLISQQSLVESHTPVCKYGRRRISISTPVWAFAAGSH